MTLSDYMKSKGLDDAAMASKIGGCSEFAVKKWKYGERMPRLKQIARIKTVTGGDVSIDDFMPGISAGISPRAAE